MRLGGFLAKKKAKKKGACYNILRNEPDCQPTANETPRESDGGKESSIAERQVAADQVVDDVRRRGPDDHVCRGGAGTLYREVIF